MALVPAQSAPAMPNFAGGGAPAPQGPAQAPMAPQGKPEKPVTHGLVNGQEIDERLSTMPRSAQQMFVKAVASIPDLADIFGTAIGPEAHDYIAAVAQAIKQQSQQNSPQDVSAAAPDDQNPPAPAGGPAMATPPTQ